MNLYHYFERGTTPFLTLSDLSDEEARKVQDALKNTDNVYTNRDHDGKYMYFRRVVEQNVRKTFLEKGGQPKRQNPIYFILGESHRQNHPIYNEWFKDVDYIEIPTSDFDMDTVSFTYGASFVANHPEHFDQTKYLDRVCTYEEIKRLLNDKGWPQDSVKEDSPFFVPRYIEAQVWNDIKPGEYFSKKA